MVAQDRAALAEPLAVAPELVALVEVSPAAASLAEVNQPAAALAEVVLRVDLAAQAEIKGAERTAAQEETREGVLLESRRAEDDRAKEHAAKEVVGKENVIDERSPRSLFRRPSTLSHG